MDIHCKVNNYCWSGMVGLDIVTEIGGIRWGGRVDGMR